MQSVQETNSYENLFEERPDGNIIMDGGGTFLQCNKAIKIALGYSDEELRDSNIYHISPDIQPDTGFFSDIAFKMFMDKAMAGKPQHFEWTLLHKNNDEITFRVFLSNYKNDKLLAILLDITELKKLQQEKDMQQAVLIQQSKLAELGSMIGAIAHQWKQPLNTISIIAQDLPDSFDAGELDKETVSERSEQIINQINFMSQTLDSFRNFYTPTTKAKRFDLRGAIVSATDLLKVQLAKNSVELDLSDLESIKVVGFENEFKQVVLNIINNSKDVLIEKKIKDSKIKIRSIISDQKVFVEFEDNGGGIPKELLPHRIFLPFVSTKGDKGTGIGLSLSKKIIEEKMHGDLQVRNGTDGAIFTITMPLPKDI